MAPYFHDLRNKLHQISTRLRHYAVSQTKFRLHSPFVYRLYTDVLDDRRMYYAFPEIEKTRADFLKNRSTVELSDHGAGRAGRRTVAGITRRAASPRKLGQTLFRLVEHLQPRYILELGTSLGIGTRYLAGPGAHEHLLTLEGDPAIASLAATHLGQIPGLIQRTGRFEDILEASLEDMPRLDFVWLDGNHTREATLRNFVTLLDKSHTETCIAIDDIHWSREMSQAWKEICDHPRVTLTVDVWRFGMVFLREEQKEREHFVLKW